MLLKNIKLSGFKSFVDPTNVLFPSSLVGVVGPNGCGKSNVIDAVRWVMGESSAKTLRGDSMSDVIFNGATTRAPVNQASVEMVFDNSDHSLSGEYAAYSEIAVRRVVTREGQSNYYLNGTKCRRKDIASIFLGTGLGPRSYSIIQQGTVSRLVEAKPEELRTYLEEAAGISKYKDRRRETSNRIKHTRENMERLMDVRLELEKQLAHLKRQANAAERFKVLKQEQRQSKAALLAVRWKDFETQMQAGEQALAEKETALEAQTASLRQVELTIERLRESHIVETGQFNDVQRIYYGVGGEIGKVEQSIAHHKERKQQLTLDFEQANTHWQELSHSMTQDKDQLSDLEAAISDLSPQTLAAKQEKERLSQALASAEAGMKQWQAEWESFTALSAETTKEAEVEKTRIQHIEQQLTVISGRNERVSVERGKINTDEVASELATVQAAVASLKEDQQRAEQHVVDLGREQEQTQTEQQRLQKTLDNDKRRLQEISGRAASLEALQQAALGDKDKALQSWIRGNNLSDNKRLAQIVDVESGWELAVETVLGDYLQAVCLDNSMSMLVDKLGSFSAGCLTLLTTSENAVAANGTLAAKVTSSHCPAQLRAIYAAETLEEALAKQATLQDHESIITREGIWLGRSWLRVSKDKDQQAGVIAREKELKSLVAEKQALEAQLETQQTTLVALRDQLKHLDGARRDAQKECNVFASKLSQLGAEEKLKKGKLQHFQQRLTQLSAELTQLSEEKEALDQQLQSTRTTWQAHMARLEQQTDAREQLEQRRGTVEAALQEARDQFNQGQRVAHDLAMQLQSSQTQHSSLSEGMARMSRQFESLKARKSQLETALNEGDSPIEQLEASRKALLEKQLSVEADLQKARESVATIDKELKQQETARQQVDAAILELRQAVEQSRLAAQSAVVRRQTIEEQLQEMQLVVKDVLATMETMPPIEQLESQLEHIQRRIDRLGPINLAAIDEYDEKLERKTYLDAQNADLEEALAMLESAIAKIDRETRDKFKETYDIVNDHFKTLFPKIFGGGSAHLELTGNDLLDTGVTVMARPPGKRNSTIHLLSGGEKAMTAIALVFSIFQLNPAPFCMLDEVDAPLDDANVGRYCDLIKEMSQKVQFIVITHNKLTMETMNQLMGVTMHEPGVSRLVSVDVDEAAEMVVA